MDTAASPISPDELAARLRQPDAPLLLDVRREPAWLASDVQLAGAQRCPPEDVAAWAARQSTGQAVVVYCVYGHQVGQAAAAALRAAGLDARFLAGGLHGGEDGVDAPEDIARWRRAALAREPRA